MTHHSSNVPTIGGSAFLSQFDPTKIHNLSAKAAFAVERKLSRSRRQLWNQVTAVLGKQRSQARFVAIGHDQMR